jgi:spore maturation protein CgeB
MALKLRDFDGPMSGSCYVTQHNPDLDGLYRIGEEIVTYRDRADLVRKVTRLLGDDALRETIAARGRTRAQRAHTWEARFQGLVDLLRGICQELHWDATPVDPACEGDTGWPWSDEEASTPSRLGLTTEG